jgi:DNA-directed RNA polymerase specialized sigma24 family protein
MFSPSKLERFKVSKEELENLGSEFFSEALPILEKLYNTTFWIILNKKSARKIIKQTFSESIDYCNITKNEADWKSWIYRIWMREIFSFFSYFENDKNTNFEFIDYANIDSSNADFIRDGYHSHVQAKELINLLQKLPPVLRVPLIMKEVYSFNYEKISELIDVPIGVIATRIYRARKLFFLNLNNVYLLEDEKIKWEQKAATKKIFKLRNSSLLADEELNPEQKNELSENLKNGEEFESEILIQRGIKNILQNSIPTEISVQSLRSKIERKAKKNFGNP